LSVGLLLGIILEISVGLLEDSSVGELLGIDVVGIDVGTADLIEVGLPEGIRVGIVVGDTVFDADGNNDGNALSATDG